ncbi:MAG: hypothetical protein ACPL5I_10650 [Thermodesulfobacteriota bacterium]
MKKVIILVVTFIFFNALPCSAAEFGASTGVNLDWWDDTTKARGYQLYVPLKLQAQYQPFYLQILAGYAYTYYDPSAGESRSLSAPLDTKLNLSYEVLDKLPVDILIGLDVNLPTGKTALAVKDLVLMMDEELISINRFGEGYNINPTLTLAKELGNYVVGLSAGYAWRGKYDYSTESRNYDPGDIFTLSAEVRYDFTRTCFTRLFGNYAWYDKDKLEGADQYQEGDLYLLGWGLHYNPAKWQTGLVLRSIYRNKSKFQDSQGSLATEEKNSHGLEWRGDLYLHYLLTPKTTLKTGLQGVLITENDYPQNSTRYMGKKEKLSLGLGATTTLGAHFTADILLKGFIMHDEDSQYPEYRSGRTYRGFSLGAFITGLF